MPLYYIRMLGANLFPFCKGTLPIQIGPDYSGGAGYTHALLSSDGAGTEIRTRNNWLEASHVTITPYLHLVGPAGIEPTNSDLQSDVLPTKLSSHFLPPTGFEPINSGFKSDTVASYVKEASGTKRGN